MNFIASLIKTKLQPFVIKMWLFITLIPLVIVFFISQLYQVYITGNVQEHALIFKNGALYFLLFIGCLVLFFAFSNVLRKFSPRIIFTLLSIVFLFCALFLVFNADPRLRADQFLCYKAAIDFNHGNYQSFIPGGQYPKGYTNYYPFQLGWISVLRLITLYSKNGTFLYFLNTLVVLLSNYFIFKISDFVSDSIYVKNLTIIFSFAFLPCLFNVLFVYGNAVGFLLFLIAIFYFLKNVNSFKWINLSVIFIACVFAYLVKSNFQIAIITLALASIVLSFSNYKRLATLIILFAIPLVNVSLSAVYTRETHYNVNYQHGIPKTAYMVMALNSDNYPNYGWINYYTLKNYQESGYNYNRARKAAYVDLKKRVRYLSAHPKFAFNFFKIKLITTWADNLFESVWNGPQKSLGWHVNPGIMSKIYSVNCMNLTNRILSKVSKLVVSFILLGTVFQMIVCWKNNRMTLSLIFLMISVMYLTGGFLFHIIWETKSQYVWQYIFILIPSASAGWESLLLFLHRYSEKIFRHKLP